MSCPRVLWLFPLLLLVTSACGQNIGDACESALDCSSQGSRLCDQTQPNGYCTIRGCEKGTCPDNSVCVKFRPAQERLAVTYCMYECDEDSDCRNDEGYQCARASDFGSSSGEAEILGNAGQRFCAAKPKTPIDAGAPMMSMPAEPSESPDSGSASDASSETSDASSNTSDASSTRDSDAPDAG